MLEYWNERHSQNFGSAVFHHSNIPLFHWHPKPNTQIRIKLSQLSAKVLWHFARPNFPDLTGIFGDGAVTGKLP